MSRRSVDPDLSAPTMKMGDVGIVSTSIESRLNLADGGAWTTGRSTHGSGVYGL
jgi:hypothetical protein